MPKIKIVQKQNKTTEITISGELTIYEARAFYEQHIKSITSQQQMNINLVKLTEIDTAGIQVLIMLMKFATEQGAQIQMIHLSSAIKQYSKMFNLHHYFPSNDDGALNADGGNK